MKTLNLSLRYSYADYLTWVDNIRRELINGFAFKMAAPSSTHQIILSNLHRDISHFLRKKPCKVFVAPFDVRLYENGEKENKKVHTVVQPDICVICDLSKIDKRGCLGSPDLIIEIVSSKNSKRDVKDKFEVYEKFGVKEYWVVRPDEKNVHVFLLNENRKYFLNGIYTQEDSIPVFIFNGDLIINLNDIFE